MSGLQTSENLTKFIGFFNSLNELGIKIWHDEKEKEISIKGELKHADLDFGDVSNVLISQGGYDIEYVKTDGFESILIWKNGDGKRELVKAVSVKGVISARFSRSYLHIRYSDVYEVKENVVYTDGFDEVVGAIRSAGFGVEFYPEKREIRVKGEIRSVFSFVDPRVRVVLSSGDSELVLYMDGKDYRLKLMIGYNDVEFVIGEVGQTRVEVDGQHLIIRYPAVGVLSY
jgi:predicted N-acetyltransferase YhbS